MTNIPLVIFLGILCTVQTHISKALERQGIEVFDQLKTKLLKGAQAVGSGGRKPLIYILGIILNNTVFIWALLAQPHGPPALFTSMFGMGLVFLLGYAAFVMKERISRRELTGAGAIVTGTLVIGIENISRPQIDRHTMNLDALLVALGLWLALSLALVFTSRRRGDLRLVAFAFGFLAGGLGSLDPFFKGIGQNYGGQSAILPSNAVGTIFFVSSFIIGFLSFLVTQFGFAAKVRASLLVPVYNATYIALPVLWQVLLLPAYRPTLTTGTGLLLILAGVALMRGLR